MPLVVRNSKGQFAKGCKIRQGCKGVTNSGSFKKGMTPWNKGLKFNTSHGGFKKGNIPDNYAPNGTISIRKEKQIPVKFIKLDGRWIRYNRYVYEQHFGALKKDEFIIHLDGDYLNCNISNLMKVSKSEISYLKNSELYRNEPELTRAFILSKRLKKRAEENEKNAQDTD